MTKRGRPRKAGVKEIEAINKEYEHKMSHHLLKAFNKEQYIIIPCDGGYCLYDRNRKHKRANAQYLGRVYISTDGKKYMGFKLTKHRYEIFTKVVSIYQPFYETSQIALYEDVYETKPAFRETLMKDAEEIRQSFGDVERVSINKTVKSLEFLNNPNNTLEMIKPGVSSIEEKVVVKEAEPKEIHSMKNLIPKREVMVMIDPKNAEKFRSKYGVKKVLTA
jgi:hypothetical protein